MNFDMSNIKEKIFFYNSNSNFTFIQELFPETIELLLNRMSYMLPGSYKQELRRYSKFPEDTSSMEGTQTEETKKLFSVWHRAL